MLNSVIKWSVGWIWVHHMQRNGQYSIVVNRKPASKLIYFSVPIIFISPFLLKVQHRVHDFPLFCFIFTTCTLRWDRFTGPSFPGELRGKVGNWTQIFPVLIWYYIHWLSALQTQFTGCCVNNKQSKMSAAYKYENNNKIVHVKCLEHLRQVPNYCWESSS